MPVDRRQFVAAFGSTLAAAGSSSWPVAQASPGQKPYGSGSFGEWIEDEFGLPAFRYTCDQTRDPKAVTQVGPGISLVHRSRAPGGQRPADRHRLQLRPRAGAAGRRRAQVSQRVFARTKPIRRRHRLPDRWDGNAEHVLYGRRARASIAFSAWDTFARKSPAATTPSTRRLSRPSATIRC
jgi:hypothetical protein